MMSVAFSGGLNSAPHAGNSLLFGIGSFGLGFGYISAAAVCFRSQWIFWHCSYLLRVAGQKPMFQGGVCLLFGHIGTVTCVHRLYGGILLVFFLFSKLCTFTHTWTSYPLRK